MSTSIADVAETSLERFLLQEREAMKGELRYALTQADEARREAKEASERETRRVAEQIEAREAMRKERDEAIASNAIPPRLEIDALRKELGCDTMDITWNDLVIRAADLRQRAEKAERDNFKHRRAVDLARAYLGNEGRCQKHDNDETASCRPARLLREALDALQEHA